ncbi:MAG: LysR substrate-binding domain-containing protein [Ilumatobacteraceae bacterium]
MNLRDLEYLVAIADHRHFGRAAEACFVSQPTLSTQVKKLEAELGVQLVERNPRQVMLTSAGSAVVERARVVLREAAGIRDVARQMSDPETGSLRLGMFPTLGPYLLPHVVGSIRERFPKLELLLVEDKTEALLDGVRAGALDAALVALPIGDDDLHHDVLFDEDFVLAVPQDHPLASNPGPVASAALGGERLLLLDDGHCLRDHALDVCRLTGASERSGFRATSLETLRQMVVAGVGVTLLPRLSVQPPVPASDGVILVAFDEPVPHRTIAMVWRATSPAGSFLPRLAAIFRALPAGLTTGSRAPSPVADR